MPRCWPGALTDQRNGAGVTLPFMSYGRYGEALHGHPFHPRPIFRFWVKEKRVVGLGLGSAGSSGDAIIPLISQQRLMSVRWPQNGDVAILLPLLSISRYGVPSVPTLASEAD